MSEPEKSAEIAALQASKSLMLQKVIHAHADQLFDYIRIKIPVDLQSILDPRDVLQDTFFEAFQRIAEFKPTGTDATYRWLLTIARRRAIWLIRRQRTSKRGGNRKLESQQVAVSIILEDFAVYSRTPSQSAMSHELAAIVQRSIGRIEPDYREVIQLRYLEGLSAKQSAFRMGRTEDAIFKLCSRALNALKSQMQFVAVGQ